jgi:hypothetical protein
MSSTRIQRLMVAVGIFGGLLLTAIGIRYFLMPDSAADSFGLANPLVGYELHYMVGLRNVWLGFLAVAFALLRQWLALMLWAGIGAVVCFADATIAATSSGKLPQVAFHFGSGIICVGATLLIWRILRSDPQRASESRNQA